MNDNKIQAGYACFSSIHHMITIKDTMGLHLVIFYKKNKQKDKYHRICIVESKVILSEYIFSFSLSKSHEISDGDLVSILLHFNLLPWKLNISQLLHAHDQKQYEEEFFQVYLLLQY